jgi:hypothetical protein
MADVTNFVAEWASTISTLGLIGVTVWYAIQTQSMAKLARESAESSREAAEHSARSAAVAAAGTTVDFHLSPTYAFELETEGLSLNGVRIECSGAAVYVHGVEIEEVWALDPEEDNTPPSFTTTDVFREGEIPALVGLDAPTLMHKDEFIFLTIPREKWTEVNLASLFLTIDYSFDGKQPLRRRSIEWEKSRLGTEARSFDD